MSTDGSFRSSGLPLLDSTESMSGGCTTSRFRSAPTDAPGSEHAARPAQQLVALGDRPTEVRSHAGVGARARSTPFRRRSSRRRFRRCIRPTIGKIPGLPPHGAACRVRRVEPARRFRRPPRASPRHLGAGSGDRVREPRESAAGAGDRSRAGTRGSTGDRRRPAPPVGAAPRRKRARGVPGGRARRARRSRVDGGAGGVDLLELRVGVRRSRVELAARCVHGSRGRDRLSAVRRRSGPSCDCACARRPR